MKIDAIGSVATIDDIQDKLNPIDSGSEWDEANNNAIHPEDDFSAEALQKKTDRSVEQMQKEFQKSLQERNEWRDRRIQMNMAQAADAVPDDEARINVLARQFNAPPEMVRNYRQLFESRARELKFDGLLKTHPKTAHYLSDPNNARIAHDDIDNIMELEALVTNPDGFTIAGDFGDRAAGARLAPVDFAVDSVRNLAAGAIGGVIKGSGSVSSYIARALPILGTNAEADLYNPVPLNGDEQAARYREAEETGKKLAEVSGADELYRIGERVTEAIAGDGMKEYGFASRAWMSGMQSLGNMGPAVLGSIITRNPAFALTWAGLSEGGESFMGDVLKGNGFAQATAHGFVNGGIEVATEYIPIVRLIKDAAVGTPFIKTFLRNWSRETPTEMVATAGQTLSDKIADRKDGHDIGYVFLEWLSELPANELETAIATLPMSLGFSGAARISQIRASRATEKGIAALNDSAKASKVRGRAKNVYETLVKTQTEGTPLENAYVNTEAWQAYFQKQGLDPKEQAERYGVTNYDEAVTTGTDLTIPFPEYQSGFSASDHAPYFVRDTKLSEKGMTANERETYLQRLEEQVRETEELLEKIGKESENARTVNDILSELTDEMAVQLESRYDKKTARTQATIAARAFVNPVHKDIVERAREEGKELSSDEIAGKIRDWFARYGLTVNANATPTTVNTRRNIDPYIDSQLEKLRRNELPKERDVYGQSLMEYIREKGGLLPDDITRDLVKNKQLPRSILNEKGMGADEFAALQEVLDFGIGNEQTQGDNVLLDALVDEYTTGEKRYSNTRINGELFAEAQTLNDLANDLKAAGIDITTDTDNTAVREALSKYYEAQNGENTREKPETSETERYEQRGFTESDEPTAEERAEANRQYDEIKRQYEGTDQWLKAPNGQPTKLNERQWIQVRTPNFKRWLGFDWETDAGGNRGLQTAVQGRDGINARVEGTSGTSDTGLVAGGHKMAFVVPEVASKTSGSDNGIGRKIRAEIGKENGHINLLDPETGEPRIFYHGTKDSFDAFDLNSANRKDAGNLGDGIYLTADHDQAGDFGKNKKSGRAGLNVMPLFVQMKKPYIEDATNKASNLSKEEAVKRTEALKAQGYDGIISYNFNQPDWQEYPHMAVVFSPEQVKSAVSNIGTFTDNPNILRQGLESEKEGKVRGATIINPYRTMRIELFKNANYSTFIHETGHFMLEVYGDLASDLESSAYIRNEYATIRKYLGAEDGKPISREQHEKFARSFEAYLMEGKAPSPELQSIFSRFKTWLYNIYKTLTALDVKLNKDIREVFDRMMATDNEIAIMRESNELQPLFATAEKMGVSQDEFDAYRKIGDSELVKAQDIFRQKAMHAKLREKTKAYQEELEAEKKRVAREYDRDPVVTAFNDLTSDDDFSLNEDELRRVYGKAFMSKLPKRNGKRIYSKDGQVSLEDLAESLEFSSGDALIRAIARMPNRDQYVEDKARQNIMDREGDILSSDDVADEAENALHNEYMAERLKKELAVLNHLKQAGKAAKLSEQRKRIEQRKEAKRIEEDVVAQMDAMKVVAASIIAEKKVKDIKPALYLRAMQATSRKSRQALNKTSPDYAAAARQKQAEIMNNLLYKEATRVQKELDKRTLQAKAIARKSVKDALKTRDSLGINKAKYIAALIGIGKNQEVYLGRIRTEEKNMGFDDAFRYDVAGTLSDLNTETALNVLEDIRANWDQARRDKVMVIDGRRVEIDKAAKEVSGKLREFGKTHRSKLRDDSIRNTLIKAIGSLALYHTRMESFCDMVDGAFVGEETGPMMRYLFNPVKQGANQTRLAQAEYTKKLSAIIDGFGFTKETIEAPELGYTFGKDTGYGKAELIHAMLHTGNMSNLQRLIVGHGWGTIQNGQVDTRRWNAFMSRMISEGRITEQDFDRVQQIWDVFDELKPKSQHAYKEVFGRYFDEITATPFFEFGKRYNGGYIPAIYDNRESKAGEKQLDPTRDLINEMGSALPKLAAGWGNSRVEGNHGPLLLDLGALRTHINRQILFSYMAPVNRDVSSLLNKQNIRDALRDYDPEFYGKVIKPWLSRAITQNLEATGKQPTPYDRYARTLRTRAGVSIMFGNIVNAIEQIFDMTSAYSKVKSRYLTDAFKTMVSDRSGTVQAVMDASSYMRGRMNAEIMAANGLFEQALRPGKLKNLDRWLIDNAYFLQASVDNFCGPLTWTAAYNQATEAGLSHSDAVAQADSVVRQVFGANAAEDISNFEGGTPLQRMFTQFTGYFVQRANLFAGEYSKIQRSDIANKKAAAAILLLQTVLLPAWIGAALRKIAAGSDDDETFGSWLIDVFGWGTLNYGLSMGGLGGQALNVATDYHRGKSFSSGRVFYPPAIKLVEDFFKAFKIFPDAWNGELDVPKFMKYMSDFERVVPGLPVIPARPMASLRYAHDFATDEVNPISGYDFVRGMATGRASSDSK